MRKEVQTVIRSAESLGDNVHRMVLVVPEIALDVIEVTHALAGVPWSVVAGSLDHAAEKVDEVIEIVP